MHASRKITTSQQNERFVVSRNRHDHKDTNSRSADSKKIRPIFVPIIEDWTELVQIKGTTKNDSKKALISYARYVFSLKPDLSPV